MIPRYAEPIIQARATGMKPAEMVLISDGVAGLHWKHSNPVIVVDPVKPANGYDFRFLTDLEVEIVTAGTDRRAQALSVAIARVRPWYLGVTFDTGEMFRIVHCGELAIRSLDVGLFA